MPTTWEAAAPAAPPCGDAYGAAGAAGAAAAGLVVEASGPSGSSSHSSAEVTLRLFAGLPRPDAHPQRVQVELEHVGNKVSGGGAGCGGGGKAGERGGCAVNLLAARIELGAGPPLFLPSRLGAPPRGTAPPIVCRDGEGQGPPRLCGGMDGWRPLPALCPSLILTRAGVCASASESPRGPQARRRVRDLSPLALSHASPSPPRLSNHYVTLARPHTHSARPRARTPPPRRPSGTSRRTIGGGLGSTGRAWAAGWRPRR